MTNLLKFLFLALSILFYLPGMAQLSAPSVQDLLSKYESLESGKIHFRAVHYSTYAVDSLFRTQELSFRKYDQKAKNYKGFDIHLEIIKDNKSSHNLKYRDSVYTFGDSLVRRLGMDSKLGRRYIKNPLGQLPVINSKSFFLTYLRPDKLTLQSEDESHWHIAGEEFNLSIRKADSLIDRIAFTEKKSFDGSYSRIEFIDQQYNIAFPEPDPFDPSHLLSHHITRTIPPKKPEYPSLIGKSAPNWTLPNLNGDSISIADFKGKYVLLDYWFIGCVPCVRAMPEIQALAENLDTAQVKVISVEMYQEDAEKVKKFMEGKGAFYETVLAKRNKEVSRSYGVTSFPTFFIINPEGVIEHKHRGYSPGRMKKLIKKLEKLADE